MFTENFSLQGQKVILPLEPGEEGKEEDEIEEGEAYMYLTLAMNPAFPGPLFRWLLCPENIQGGL